MSIKFLFLLVITVFGLQREVFGQNEEIQYFDTVTTDLNVFENFIKSMPHIVLLFQIYNVNIKLNIV